MAGVVLENLSWKKLIILGVSLLIILIVFFAIGAGVAPAPNNVISILGTKCYDRHNQYKKKFFALRGKDKCESLDSIDRNDTKIIKEGIRADQIVFSFWIPWPREGRQLQMSRWFQTMLSVLQVDIEHDEEVKLGDKPTIQLDVKLGYSNEGDKNWTMFAHSTEDRNLQCTLREENRDGGYYDCDLLQFELGSVHHDYYLLNVRLPTNPYKGINMEIGKIRDLHLLTIHQNGGFTIVWFSIKTFMFPMVLAVLIWFWRRIKLLCRTPNLLERTLFALGIAMTFLNFPMEWLTLEVNIPFMLLMNDIRQGVFYAMLLCFWIIFAGEHIMDQMERNRLALYWKHLSAVVFGCVCLFIFEMFERGVQLRNPFFSIWATETGKYLALAFIILAGVAACVYFLFLCYMVFCVFRNISAKTSTLPNMSNLRQNYYMGYRFKFLVISTLFCAAVTVIFFIISQLSEGQWKWGDEDLNLQYTSGFFTGVYGMWNVYIFGLLSLYAPSQENGNNSKQNATLSTLQTAQAPVGWYSMYMPGPTSPMSYGYAIDQTASGMVAYGSQGLGYSFYPWRMPTATITSPPPQTPPDINQEVFPPLPRGAPLC